jgi:hypothetical protein
LEEKKDYYSSWPAPGYLQNGTNPEIRVGGVFILEERSSEQAGSAEAVRFSRLQYIMSAHLRSKAVYSF